MANYVSPGVYVLEKDTSDYPAAINPSVVGLVGFASKGPTDKATLITNGERLVSVFGEPSEDIAGQGLEGALEILEATNSLYYVRVASDSAAEATGTIQLGACPAVVAAASAADTYNIIVKDETGAVKLNKTITTTATGVDALKAKLGGDTTLASKVSVFPTPNNLSAIIVGNYAGSGASISVSSSSNQINKYNLGAVDGASDTSAVASGVSFYTSGLGYKVESVYPGAGYNYAITAAGVESGNSLSISTEGGDKVTLNVLQDGVAAESFLVGLLNDEDFVETKINTTSDNLKSNIIKGYLVDAGGDVAFTGMASFDATLSTLLASGCAGFNGSSEITANNSKPTPFIKFVKQSGVKLLGGDNGIPTLSTDQSDLLIGEVTDSGKTGLQVLDNDLLNLGMAAVPGFSDDAVQNALITVAENTKEFLAVVSPPYAIGSVQNAIDWSNGLSTERTSAINSSYAAIYWPWVKVFSTYDGVDRWYDPAIYGIRQMCVTDDISESWFAPAGFTRGRLTKPTDVEIGLSQGDRDALYSNGNVINPVVNFPQQGITIFGQRTAQRAPSALDRINVRRMMIIIRKIILASTRQFAFEPNDPSTWAEIEALTASLLDPIARGRGITEFDVVCDSTTNTPDRIERGELWCKVVIRPTKTAEIIVFELNLINQSASIS